MTTKPDKEKLKPLAALFVAFPRQEREGTEAGLLDVYLMAVENIAPDFVSLACKRFIQGQVERSNLTFRPTPPELAAEARHLQEREQRHQQYAALPSREPQKALPTKREPFRPYPALWAALGTASDVAWTLDRLTFGEMTEASKIFATEGVEAARVWIEARGGTAAAATDRAAAGLKRAMRGAA